MPPESQKNNLNCVNDLEKLTFDWEQREYHLNTFYTIHYRILPPSDHLSYNNSEKKSGIICRDVLTPPCEDRIQRSLIESEVVFKLALIAWNGLGIQNDTFHFSSYDIINLKPVNNIQTAISDTFVKIVWDYPDGVSRWDLEKMIHFLVEYMEVGSNEVQKLYSDNTSIFLTGLIPARDYHIHVSSKHKRSASWSDQKIGLMFRTNAKSMSNTSVIIEKISRIINCLNF